MVKNGCGQSCHRTLKLTVSQKWTDGINWFFVCWHKFRKTKSWFNDFCVGLVKNGCGLLVHETLKYAVSDELSWFCECWLCCNSFGSDWYPTLWFLNAWGPLQLYFLFEFEIINQTLKNVRNLVASSFSGK